VAAVQLSSQDDVQANLEAAVRAVDLAAERGARLVLLPENFAYFGAEEGRRAVAEPLGPGDGGAGAPIQRVLGEAARKHGVTIVAGGMPELSDDPARPFNTCAVFGPAGGVVAAYRKMHLFDVDLADGTRLSESKGTSPGGGASGAGGTRMPPVTVVGVDGFQVGLSICYDVRFPELYRLLVDQGAEVLLVPAAFTLHTGKDHWHVLLRARAIESQAWVVAAAQWGKHPGGRTTYGHSLVADPWGTVVAEAPDRTGIVVADLEREDLDRVRRSLPSLRHRRL
jgi:predicted amidohydrolase